MGTVSKKRKIIDAILLALVIVLVIVVFLRLFVFVDITVSGLSMYPTLYDNQSLWGNRMATAHRADIVVFTYSDTIMIKRVVALSGDKVWAEKVDDQYYLYVLTPEGDTLSEQYSWRGQEVTLSAMIDNNIGFLRNYDSIDNSYTVPDGYMLPLGDNRAISHDGRDYGVV